MKGLSALIPAAGSGSRLGQGPKAWLEFEGRPAFVWLVLKLMQLADEVILALPASHRQYTLQVAEQYGLRLRLIEGGETRQQSVFRLVEAAQYSHVLIQDVARPFATRALFDRVANAVHEHDAAAAFLPLDVPVARFDQGWVVGHIPAAEVAIFQAPQAFTRTLLLDVLHQAEDTGLQRQSTLQLWLDAGHRIFPVQGEKSNIKITMPEDWAMAQSLTEYLSR